MPVYSPGRYQCEITDQGIGESTNKNPMVLVKFKVLALEEGYAVEKQYERTYRKAVTDKTIEWVVKDLRAMGFEGNSFAEFDPRSSKFVSMVGKLCILECRINQNGYEEWNPPSDGGAAEINRVDIQEVRKLDGLFGKAFKSAPAAAPPQRTAKPQAAPQTQNQSDWTPSDEDVPF